MRCWLSALARKATTAALVCGWLGAGSAGCSSCEEPASTADAAPQADLAPVPAPAGLAAELFVSKPEATWRALRDLLGAPATLLPGSFPLLASTVLGLGAEAASAVDGEGMLVAAIAQTGTRLQVVVGLRVKSDRSLVAALTTGQAARFASERDAKTGLMLLTPKPGESGGDAVLALAGNYLLAARDRAALLELGPYVGRTLSRRRAPAEPIVLVADSAMLGGPIASSVKQRWVAHERLLRDRVQEEREQRGGRAPDFAEPEAILSAANAAVTWLAAILESLTEARLVITPRPERLDAELSVVASPKGAASEFLATTAQGDLAALLRLPATTQVALLTRASAAARQQSARDIAASIGSVFGGRLAKIERERLDGALLALAAGRGDEARYALVPGGIIGSAGVADRAALERGIQGAVDILRFRAMREPLESLFGPLAVQRDQKKVPGFDVPVARASVAMRRGARQEPALELLWTYQKDALLAALGTDAGHALEQLAGALSGTGASLASVPGVAPAAERLGAAVSFGALVDVVALSGSLPAPSGGHLLLAAGARADRGSVRAEMTKDAVRAALALATQP